MSMLEIKNIKVNFEATQALKGVSITAEKGEVHAVVGENGAGKSTLMRVLAGAITPDEGEVWIENVMIKQFTPHNAFSHGVKTVYQEFSLVSHLSAAENILLGKMPRGRFKWLVDWDEAFKKSLEILDNLGFPGIDVKNKVSQLSVSQQQVVEIAKAIAEIPKILILDEPSAVLAETELKQLFKLINRLKSEGSLILYISHRLKEVFDIADKITVLKDGEKVRTMSAFDTDEQNLINLMVGRPLSKIFTPRSSKPGKSLLEVDSLSLKGSFNDISFNLRSGEILGMFGLVGSGRTALARALYGASKIDKGTVSLNGEVRKITSPEKGVESGITYLTRNRKVDGLVLCDSILANMTFSTLKEFSKFRVLNIQQERVRVSEMIERMDIKPKDFRKHVRQQSGGNQQKVLLSRLLLAEMKVLILNEPTRGVDVNTKAEIYKLINKLADDGLSIILISSELPEVIGLSDRVLVFRNGRIADEFQKREMNEVALLASASGVSLNNERGENDDF